MTTEEGKLIKEQFEKEVNPDVHVFMIWDQAAFHMSKKVKVPRNVTVIPLPPYSPQLNPVEKLWQYLRQHHWSNRIYQGYDHLRHAANEAWHKVCLNPTKIKSICRAKYIESAVF